MLAFVYTEPLAWPSIVQAVSSATARGIKTSVTTNGLLLDRHAEGPAEAGCSSLVVSLDGPPKIHDFIRRKKGSYARATEGIAKLRAQTDAPPVTVVCAVTQWNIGHLAEFVRGLATVDIEQLFLMHTQFVDADVAAAHNRLYPSLPAMASNVFENDVTAMDFAALSQDLRAVTQLELPFEVRIQPPIIDMPSLEAYYLDPGKYVGTRCNGPFRILMIDADSEAIPAHERCFRFPVGNVTDTPLARLWHADPLRDLRRHLAAADGLLPACSRCCGGVT